MKRLKHKRAVLAVLALLSLAVSFQPLGAYERGYLDSFLLALLLSLVCLFLFCMFALWAQAVDKLVEKKKRPVKQRLQRSTQKKYLTYSIDNYTEDVKP